MLSKLTPFVLMLPLLAGATSPVTGGEARGDAADQPIREIFVPFDDLSVVLQNRIRRVFVSREAYEELLAKAKKAPAKKAPQATATVSSDYDVTIEEGRARMTGELAIDVLEDGLQAVPLDFSGVGLRTATLDEASAAIGRGDRGRSTLFVEGKGRHRLRLELVAPLQTTAAQQTLRFQVPMAAVARVRMSVPGDIQIKSGAAVVSPEFDAQADATRFELLATRGPTELVMTLNNRRLRKDRAVVARSVVIDELTEAYERVHLTASMGILHGATDQFRFTVPEGFEVTRVASPLLARWAVEAAEAGNVLTVWLREPTTETVVLNVSAIRTPGLRETWSLPKFEPLETVGQVAIVGLLAENRLRLEMLDEQGLIPLDTEVLRQSLPESALAVDAGAPAVRPVAAYYAPQAAFDLTARFDKPPARVRATTNLVLVVSDGQLEIRGGFALTPVAEKLFDCNFSVPQGWHVIEVTFGKEHRLPVEQYANEDGSSRVHVQLPRGVPPGEEYTIYFRAVRSPEGWLDDWKSREIEFPVVRIAEASHGVGAIAVSARDDLVVRPVDVSGLTPLDENKKSEYGLSGVATNLAYRYEEADYAAKLAIERTSPRITAQTYSFLRIDREHLSAHYEVAYDVAEARTRRLALSLPKDTPQELSIQGLDGLKLKEFSSQVEDGRRRWNVLLAEGRRGTMRLAISFQDRFDTSDEREVNLPLVRAENVVYQSGAAAVEGSAELDVEITDKPRKIDVGELVDAQYQPGRHLLGAFGFSGDDAKIKIRVMRPPTYDLPAAIVQRSELVTLCSTSGQSQTAARYLLLTKAQLLEVRLPEGSTLWSAYLDDQPSKPQRDGQRLLLSLPAADDSKPRDLRLVYETPVASIGLWGDMELPAPKLFLRGEGGTTGRPLPVADLTWDLHLPQGYDVVKSHGTVFTDEELGIRRKAISPVAASWLPPAPFGSAAEPIIASDGFVRTQIELGYVGDQRDRNGNVPRSRSGVLAEDASESMPQSSVGADREQRASPADSVAGSGVGGAAKQSVLAGESSASAVVSSEISPAPQGQPAGRPAPARSGAWALQGAGSLEIDLAKTGKHLTFVSLGEAPQLEVRLANRRRINAGAWGVALAIGLVGLALTRRSPRTKFRFVLAVLLVALLVPLVTPWDTELGPAFRLAFVAGCLVAAYYLFVAILGKLLSMFETLAIRRRPTTAALLLVAATLGAASLAVAAPPDDGELLTVRIAEPAKPVDVPEDAVIIPYDVEDEYGIQKARKLLVPYDKYVELWNQAYPDKKIDVLSGPAPYALAGARFDATLSGGDHLLVTGQIDVEVYADGVVSVPLPLEGGVLARAEVGGEPARVRVIEADPASNPPNAQRQRIAAQIAPRANSLAALDLQGKGRHRLDVAIRYALARRGGWQVAGGRLPVAPATALALRVPEESTEVRLGGVVDRTTYTTKVDNESIETALRADGSFRVEWRPRIAQGMIDRSLTARSTAVLDVQDDGLRVVWKLQLEFRAGERETFDVEVPDDYLVDKVMGENVRGWEEDAGRLTVTLLKAARDKEEFTLYLSRRGGVDEMAEFSAPAVTVGGAALHRGTMSIRRSPWIELRTIATEGVRRSDQRAEFDAAATAAMEESPLGLRPYQSYEFAATPFTVRLATARLVAETSAAVQTILRIADRERLLESRILFRAQARPVYRVRIAVPDDLEAAEISADEWSLTTENGRKLLTVYFTTGREGPFSILVRGRLGEIKPAETVQLPKLDVLDVESQEGHIVVQADPAFEVRTEELRGCQNVLLEQVHRWLKPQQRKVARLALHYRKPDYDGVVRIAARTPRVSAVTVTNVQVTDRALQETILLEYTIREAGIRAVAFTLPVSMQDARIIAPLLRQKTLATVANDPERVRVQLELQDAVIGEFRVLIQNDRLMTEAEYAAPIPAIESVETQRRYVAIETAGRDEVLVEKEIGVAPLSRAQRAWRTLAELLLQPNQQSTPQQSGGSITQAWLVDASAAQPALVLRSQSRAAVETVQARIGLAEAVLTLDASGTYRGVQTYHVDNSIEQFLDVLLPEGAELWTTQVAGQPVKPVEVAGAAAGRVRVPLIKTAAGDQDFAVVLKYGGKLPDLDHFSHVEFPLIRTQNVNVESSQVRLRLPKTHAWYNFGGTMRLVQDEGDLLAGWLAYQTEEIERFSSLLESKNPYARVRANYNLKRIQVEAENLKGAAGKYRSNDELQKQLEKHSRTAARVQEQMQRDDQREELSAPVDNARRLSQRFRGQRGERAENVVNELESNFDVSGQQSQESQPGEARFNAGWLKQNRLGTAAETKLDKAQAGRPSDAKLKAATTGPSSHERQPVAPRVGEKFQQLDAPAAQGQARRQGGGRRSQQARLKRYDELVQQQQAPPREADSRRFSVDFDAAPGQDRSAITKRVAEHSADDRTREMSQTPGRAAGPVASVPVGGQPAPTGLVSLDVAIPQRGIEYQFTTVRGDVQITARAVSNPLLDRFGRLGWLVGFVVVVSLVGTIIRRRNQMESA